MVNIMPKFCVRYCGFLLLAGLLLAPPASAAAKFDPPSAVVITPQNARITVETSVRARMQDGQPVLTLTLPQDAQSLTLEIAPPHTARLRSWSMTSVAQPLEEQGSIARQRAALTAERDSLLGDVQTLKARAALWSTPPSGTWTAEGLEQRETRMQQTLPQLTAALTAKERSLAAVQKQLSLLPDTTAHSNLLVIALTPDVTGNDVGDNTDIALRYAYTLPSCNWQPTYTINAVDDAIQVRLLADIRQYSGMDWKGAHITLALRDGRQRAPSPVHPWDIRKKGEEAPDMRVNRAAAPMMLAAAPAEGHDGSAPQAYESAAQSGWVLPAASPLPEGTTRLPITQEVWKDALQRLARPAQGDGRVWLTARHTFDSAVLPAGNAVFLLDGSAVGEGTFRPVDGRVDMYFGADPLVTVSTAPDTRMSGKSGIINARQTWKWGWTYTVTNNRARAVTVRLEEPAPQAGDERIAVSLDDTPKARTGENHTLYWELAVPARSTAQVRHAVEVSAPQDMDIRPGR